MQRSHVHISETLLWTKNADPKVGEWSGGARTPDLLTASQVLSQLSYRPIGAQKRPENRQLAPKCQLFVLEGKLSVCTAAIECDA